MSNEEREPTPAEIATFRRAAKALAKLGAAGVRLYLANDTLHLMTGPSHGNLDGSGIDTSPHPERIRASVLIRGSSGGDW